MALDGFMVLGGVPLMVDGIPLRPASVGSALKPPTATVTAMGDVGSAESPILIDCTITDRDATGTGIRLHFTTKDTSTGAAVGLFPNADGPVSFSIPPGVVVPGVQVVVWAVTLGAGGAESPPSESAAFTYSPQAVPPSNVKIPTISGTPTVPNVLNVVDEGTWFGFPVPTLSKQWQRDGTNISGATGTNYTLTALDAGKQVGVLITANNSTGIPAFAASETMSIAAAGLAPVNITLPAITGTPTVGQLQTATPGTWSGTPAPTFTYQWRLDAVDIPGATLATYTPIATDATHQLNVRVFAHNTSGDVFATSNVRIIAASVTIPVNTGLPVVTGNNSVGSTLTTTNGTWTQSPTSYSRKWQRGGTDIIPSATGLTYILQAADAGFAVGVIVTAVNAAGNSAPAGSNLYQVPVGLTPPVNTVAPVISGTPTRGQSLSTTNGTWTGSPAPTYAYQWQRDTTDISGATGKGRLLTVGDVGHTLRCVVTAKNSSGEVSLATASSAAVADSATAPLNTVAPSITGIPVNGETLTALTGTWTGTPAPTITRNWQRDSGSGFVDIAGEIGLTYVLSSLDVGFQVRIFVQGDNASGTGRAASTPVVVAASATAPSNITVPTFTGSPTVGSTLTMVSPGTWSGNPAPALELQWRSGNSDIAGQQGLTYLLQSVDATKQISLQVTATNIAGTDVAISASVTVSPLAAAPACTTLPTITTTAGTAGQVGSTLTANNGVWVGTPTPTLTRFWQRAGLDIPGATGLTYVTQAIDNGKQITLRVHGNNTAGDTDAFSIPTDIAAWVIPTNTVRPTVSASAAVPRLVGTVFTESDQGTWTGNPTPGRTRNWQLDQIDIPGAVNPTYTSTAADAGGAIRLRIHGQSSAGSADAFSIAFGLASLAQPDNTDPPTITSNGSTVGSVITAADLGTWTGNPTPTRTRNWQRDNVDISGATGTAYTTQALDAGTDIRLRVRGTNTPGGFEDAFSTSIAIDSSLPVNTVAPQVTGVGTVGSELTSTNGTWTGVGTITYAKQWQRNQVNISGATLAKYTLQALDNGTSVRCQVTAHNSSGDTIKNSNAINVAPYVIPVADPNSPPVISGTGTVGSVLSVTNTGGWTGNPFPTFAYQWQRDGSGISGATDPTYTLVALDAGTNVRCKITGTNVVGSDVTWSQDKAVAASGLPFNTVKPIVTGGTNVGQTLTGSNGTWTGATPITFTYLWGRDGVAIPGATNNAYVTQAADADHGLNIRVIAHNSVGDTTVYSDAVQIQSGAAGDWAVVDVTVANHLTAFTANRTKKTRYRMAAGTYRDFIFPDNVNDFEIEIIPQDRNNPPVINALSFGRPSNKYNWQASYLQNQNPIGTSFTKKITIDGLDIASPKYRTLGTGSDQVSSVRSLDGEGIGWRVQGTTHPAAATAGSKENGNYCGLYFVANINVEVKNCLIEGYAIALGWWANSGSANIHHNHFIPAEDAIKYTGNNLWVHHNQVGPKRGPNVATQTFSAGPFPPHGDSIQGMDSGNDLTFEDNFFFDDMPPSGWDTWGQLHGGLIRHSDQGSGRSLRVVYRRNELRVSSDTGMYFEDVQSDGGNGIDGTNFDLIVSGNKVWTGGISVPQGKTPDIYLSNYAASLAASPAARIQIVNNVAPGFWAHGLGSNNITSNSGSTWPTGWKDVAEDRVPNGQPFSGRYGATAGVR
jgi:hypothetical protein